MARHFFAALTRNSISLAGTALAAASLTLMVALIVIEHIGVGTGGAYLGILTFLILPGLFVVGLLLIPVGIMRQHRKEKAGEGSRFPAIDLNNERTRRSFIIFLALTMINLVVLASATYKGVEVMDSTAFCGTVCHTVMQPEYTAHQRSAHARVKCAECHIGPGADWFVKSKLSGAWQVVSVAFDLYPRPVPTPIHDLRPARETCEQCHWPTKFVGDKLRVHSVYDEDEANTELKTAVLLKVGGHKGNGSSGIHWHVDPGVQIRFRASEDREEIYQVEYTAPDGTVKLFEAGELPGELGEWRQMDCVDCHNRPSHQYRLPGDEIDAALESGRIDASLPFVKREGLQLIQADYASHDEAKAGIADALAGFYRQNYPEVAANRADAVAAAGQELGQIYSYNVFPAMNVGWGTYPDHSGHQETPGCFRCHNRKLKTADGDRIPRNCSLCHSVLANKEKDPELLASLEE
jgi:hypothetical protein